MRSPLARASSISTGTASASRQNPAATGPEVASRTLSGPTASATLPPISAAPGSHLRRHTMGAFSLVAFSIVSA